MKWLDFFKKNKKNETHTECKIRVEQERQQQETPTECVKIEFQEQQPQKTSSFHEEEYRKAQENLEDIIKNQLMDKLDDLIDALEESKKDTNVYDSKGNLIGTQYSTPQLGNLADILSKYYTNNENAKVDIDILKDTLGKEIVSNISPSSNQTAFNIGDIIVNEAKDGNELAQAIVNQFPNALLQALYSKQ
jgi:hypothetical protein